MSDVKHKRYIPEIKDKFVPVENGNSFTAKAGRKITTIKGHIHDRGGVMRCLGLKKKFVLAIDEVELLRLRKAHRKLVPNWEFRNSVMEYQQVA